MSSERAQVTQAQLGWFLTGALPFVLSIALLGYSLSTGVALSFAIFWPLLQIFGYGRTLKMTKGDPAHYLVTTQIILHWMIIFLLAAMILRGEP
ncbi:MAG: hypothetical protein O3C52_00100 [Proteobacteria bacterium]|nr:hypothetical protein [Pseudomonadota bacterium]MDA0915423.1 hypothetical protein [Pseudomonadota bacterium]MDA1031773.1 hypothetical protein [Pseudomonadota bacterium]